MVLLLMQFCDKNAIELIFAAIIAAEEKRKQKEQMKILKQQVGLLLTWTTRICWQIFSPFI